MSEQYLCDRERRRVVLRERMETIKWSDQIQFSNNDFVVGLDGWMDVRV